MRFIFLLFVYCLISLSNELFSQYEYTLTTEMLNENEDSLYNDQMVSVVEQSLALYYAEYARKYNQNYESIIDSLNYLDGEIIEFSDKIYCERLNELNAQSPISIDCNEATLSTIRFFASKRRGFIRLVLGRSQLYFDLYEEKLSEYGLPLELKYLSVIESGLRPQVKSRAGALGLWQFMYRTGKMFGLNENSYIDERMDPEKSTDAACRYLKYLHSLYGDWNLALAAYNAGPGNVNKAIRRSGNKTTYWDIRPFLPLETQGYIPNFVAALYFLNYHAQHNIIPAESHIHYAQLDTICLSEGVHIATIAKILQYDSTEIKSLNPIYKHDFIPSTTPKQCISLPIQHIGTLTALEDSLYQLEKTLYSTYTNTNIAFDKNDSLNIAKTNSHSTQYSSSTNVSSSMKYYTVKSGDTFGKIAQRHGKSILQLKKLNPNINIDKLRLGQKIRIR